MDNQQVTPYEIGWLAGIVDGEGYIGMIACYDKRRSGSVQIDVQMHICNTDEAIILKCQEIIRKIGVNPYIRASKGHTNVKKDVFKIQIKHMRKLKIVLDVLLPYLVGNKQERAKLIIKFIELRMENPGMRKTEGIGRERSGRIFPYTDEELELFEACQPLQKRGTSETIRKTQRKNSEIWRVMKIRNLKRIINNNNNNS